MFNKKVLTVAVQAAIVISAASMTQGCNLVEGANSVTSTGPVFSQVNAPKGSVSGYVQDTNGNPVAGAKVYLGAKVGTTNAGGMYSFSNVPVTNTANLTDGTTTQALVLSVVAEGYLSSTVTVTPEAQIDGMPAGDTGGSVANQVTTFVSGYSVQAGNAVLPALTSTISGTLRNNTTGEALPGMDVSLDMQTVNTAQTQGVGVSTSYGTPGYTATTDASGNFTIMNAPADSNLRFVVGGYTVNTVSANATGIVVVTNDEVADTYVSDVMVTAIASGDSVNPFVTNVSGTVTAPTATPAMFGDGFDSTAGIDVTFSEPLAVNADGVYDVSIYDVTNSDYITLAAPATLSADGKTLSFATATVIPAASTIEVDILLVDLNDLSGNGAVNGAAVGYDSIYTAKNTNANQYVRLDLATWQDANLNAGPVTGMAQQLTDGTSTDGFVADSSGLTPAFSDAFDGNLGGFDIQQLNSDIVAGQRLTALATAINGGAVSVDSDNARIVFTPSNASYYMVEIFDTSAGQVVANANTFIDESANITFGAGDDFTVTDGNEASMLVGNVAPGDVITITPYDDKDNIMAGTSISVTMVDNVEPTTVIQRSYGATPTVEAPSVVADYGQGGELSQVGGTVLAGTPYLNITMQLLDDTNTAGDDLVDELIAHNAADATTGTAYLSQPVTTTVDVYDATAYGVFSANLARTVGISFSENVALTGTPATTTSVALSNWTEHNDTAVDDGSLALGNVNVDLVDVDVADVMALANTDHNSVIDFSGVIDDTAGNTGSIAQVVVRDWMPPMITAAVYSGDNMTITFNEDVAPAAGDTVGLVGLNAANAFTLDQATVDAFDLQADKTTLVIPHADWGGNITWATAMNLGTYDEGAVLAADHGGIATTVADVNGNSVAGTGSAGVDDIAFAYYNAIDVMAMSAVGGAAAFTSVAAVLDDTFTFTYTANHDIDLAATFGGTVAPGATALTALEVEAGFTLAGVVTHTVNGVGSSATLSADGRTLTVVIATLGTVTTGDTITVAGIAGGDFVSDYDGTQTATPDVITAP